MAKQKMSRSMLRMIVVGGIIVALVAVTLIAAYAFPDTAFGQLVAGTLGQFFNVVQFCKDNYILLLQNLSVLIFVWALNEVVKFLIGIFIRKRNHRATVWTIFRSIFKYGSYLIAVFIILSQWGVQTPTLLAGAGILGLALSFGAQSLIEDVISGLFIIFEKQFEVGDIIQVGSFRGKVLDIAIRTTSLEDVNGDVMTINNSDIRAMINTSVNPSPSICDIPVTYGTDIEKAEKVILAHLADMKAKIPDILEGPYYKGVQDLADSGVVLRLYAKADELKKYQVTREMKRYMKILFDKEGIEIPFNQLVVHMADDKREDKGK